MEIFCVSELYFSFWRESLEEEGDWAYKTICAQLNLVTSIYNYTLLGCLAISFAHTAILDDVYNTHLFEIDLNIDIAISK
mgnify:CR=1 FL=1